MQKNPLSVWLHGETSLNKTTKQDDSSGFNQTTAENTRPDLVRTYQPWIECRDGVAAPSGVRRPAALSHLSGRELQPASTAQGQHIHLRTVPELHKPSSERRRNPSRETRAEMGGTEVKISSMIQERVQKVQSLRQAIAQRQEETRHLTQTIYDLTSLAKQLEETQHQVDLEAENVVGEIENEISNLAQTQARLKDANVNQDVQAFLQRYSHNFAQASPLNKTASNSLSDISALKYVQQFAKDVTLDPKTAHHRLILSRDLKQVRFNTDANAKPKSTSNQARFAKHLAVLAGKGIQSGKLYFEVLVGAKTEWILGVALASLQRQGKIPHAPNCGVYALYFRMSYCETFCQPNVQVHQGKMEKVGVFVDYEGGKVSFYDVNAAKSIYTFEDCGFTETVLPYFNPCNNEFENNLGPLVIVPVNQNQNADYV
ncbi:hypothetical protein WMY93_013623 [Mugilogobius chulae]|uniref:B30.2/SPRY domain-containing protein n=1 Tax=Mugilogobius chulae TaxID=88201 RepID=A0AAW0P9N9_9GOBI